MAQAQVVTHEVPYPIQPADINASGHLWNAFDHKETEISAGYIVRMCQERGGWRPFTQDDIERFYKKSGHRGYRFNRLVEPGMAFGIVQGHHLKGGGWIVRDDAGIYYLTHEFISRCFRSSPADHQVRA